MSAGGPAEGDAGSPARIGAGGVLGYTGGMADQGVSEREFEAVADATLNALVRALESIGDDQELEVDLSMGVLTIEFPDRAKYVINSHRAARQIWMAADSSAWHFDYRPAGPGASTGSWIAPSKGVELFATIDAVLGRKLGRAVKLAG